MLRRLEFWREVPGYPGYYASSEGRIRGRRGHILKPGLAGNKGAVSRHFVITAFVCCKPRSTYVHIMVLLAFRGPRPTPQHQGAHADGNPANNRLRNLRWATPTENHKDAMDHGTGLRKLTDEQVWEIKMLIQEGVSQRRLAVTFGVHRGTISDIAIGRTHKRIGI